MNRSRAMLPLFCVCLLSTLGGISGRAQENAPQPLDERVSALVAAADNTALGRHIEALSACGSRIPGYPGQEKAVAYLRAEFARLGYTDIATDTFPVAAPVETLAELEVLETGARFPLHALWPNLVRTAQLPKEGVVGTAIGGGRGEWHDLNGKSMQGNFVFMDFNSQSNWLNAAMLGARAVILIEPTDTVRREAENKLASVPLNLPKFWISKADYARLAAQGLGMRVRLRCRMAWENAQGLNLRVTLPGSDPELSRKLVCISTYYDSMSVVPALAPGAEAACGAAVMLELARLFKAQPPKCSIMFLAVGGHHLANSGMMAFLHQHARRRNPFQSAIEQPLNPDLMVCLDLTSQNETVGVTVEDGVILVPARRLYSREFLRHANLFCDYARRLEPALKHPATNLCMNLILPEGGGNWRAFLPEGISLDGVVALTGATPAFSLVTTYDPRLAADTPLDLPEKVNLDNLGLQTRFIAGALAIGLNDPDFLAPPKMEEDRLRIFRGRLVTFDPRKSFMPDQPVMNGVGRISNGVNKPMAASTALGVRTEMLGIADEEGWCTIYMARGGPSGVEAFQLDPDTGDIVKAVDLGLEGASQYPVDFNMDTYLKERTVVLFNCRSTDLYDIVDPRYLISMDKLTLFDPGNAEPFAYSYSLNMRLPLERTSAAAPYASVFSKPGIPLKIGVSSDILGQRMLFLNAPSADSKKVSEGLGYKVGQVRLVENAPYQVLRDMHNLDEYRMRIVKKFGIKNNRLERLHKTAGQALADADEALGQKRWDRFIKFARRGLGIESRAYPDVRATADDVVKGIVFYMALLLPFALFCERLFFAFPDLKRRIIAFVLFFMLAYVMLRAVHPAFRIVETSEVILLGLIILTLCAIVVAISATRFEAQMRTLKQQRGRVHSADVSRASATATAFALGVSNMRRRKVRTLLTCVAIVLLMFIVLSFTSVKTSLRPRKLPRFNQPTYQGALIRDRTWVPMKYLALDHLSSEFEGEGTMARRSWLVPKNVQESFTQLSILLRRVTDDGFLRRTGAEGDPEFVSIRSFGLVGFDPVETAVSGVQSTLEPGGRWFSPGERKVCILPDAIAEALEIGPEDLGVATVNLLGIQAKVIGILDSTAYNDFTDLDNERLTPIDFTMLGRQALARTARASQDVSAIEGRAPLETFVHIDARNIVLMPYETVLDLGGALQSVAVKFNPESGSVSDHIERLLDRLAVTVFVGENDRVMVYSSLASSAIGGMGNIVIPVLIAALLILNTMSGSVHERLREIGTYSSVGLAPSHIGALFLAEACVFAILGGIAGYIIGQIVTKGLSAVGLLGGLTLNYSSLASVMATAVVMLTVVLSTLYPARMASRMAVPDVTRKWVLPKPDGDSWHFDFPFTVSGKEVTGLYVFFRYYFAAFEEQSVGRFYTTNTALSALEESGEKGYRLTMRAWLSPYDLGVSQDVELRAVPTGDFGVFQIQLRIERVSGQANTWVRINRGFLDDIRKQFLVWRTLAPESKQAYIDEATNMFA